MFSQIVRHDIALLASDHGRNTVIYTLKCLRMSRHCRLTYP